MAGLTKEQRAQREAEKLAAQQQEQQQEQPCIELVVMVRDIPSSPAVRCALMFTLLKWITGWRWTGVWRSNRERQRN